VKTAAHTRYKNEAGKIVPGVTTPLNLLAKPALVPWSNRLGLQGIDVTKYVDDKADIGTLGHAFSTDYLMGVETDTSHYDNHQISAAQNAALSFFKWLETNPITPILVEGQLVSETYQYGGTVDIYCLHNGLYELIDLKTGSGIWPEHTYQIAAYTHLLEENGFKVDQCRLLNIPRTEDESFLEKLYTDLELGLGWEVFNNCLNIYQLKKELKHR
jgi:hypothetical protein